MKVYYDYIANHNNFLNNSLLKAAKVQILFYKSPIKTMIFITDAAGYLGVYLW